jgi:carboxypeptidase Taq
MVSSKKKQISWTFGLTLSRGDFAPLLTWLRANVHGKGSLLATNELLRQATGSTLDAKVYEDHLKRRYLGA